MKNEATLSAEYEKYKPEITRAIDKVLSSGRYILGDEVKRFEERFADYVGAKYCVGVGSGFDALLLSFMVHKGETYRTINAPLHCSVYNAAFMAGFKLTHDTTDIWISTYKDIFYPADIIDACQSKFKRLPENVNGLICYSFHPLKPLHCYGDGGAICTNNEIVCKVLKGNRNHNPVSARLDELQAAILNVFMDHIKELIND